MTIALRGVGAVVSGTGGALTPSYPTGIAAGDAVFLHLHSKPGSATSPTVTGWTVVFDGSLGGGSAGAGTGPTRVTVYRKNTVDGTETGTLSVGAVTGANMNQASIIAWSKTAASWAAEYASGSMTTASTSVTITESPALAEASGDLMLLAVSGSANTNLGSQTIAATGATYGTAVEHVDTGTNNGDDGRLSWVSRPVTGGPASAASVYTATATAAMTAGVVFIRLSETAGGDVTFTTTIASATADGQSASFLADSTVATSVGSATADGAAGDFTAAGGPVTFTTVVGDASADGQSSAFLAGSTFATSAASGTADGGASGFLAGSTFGTASSDATADGGATTFAASSALTTAVGVATADGGVGAFSAGGSANMATTVADASADGGAGTFAAGATFTTATSTASADGASSTFDALTVMATLAAVADADGGIAGWLAAATLTTLAAAASADGGSSAFTGTGGERDIAVTVSGPTSHPLAVTGPAAHLLDVSTPTGHPFAVTGPRS